MFYHLYHDPTGLANPADRSLYTKFQNQIIYVLAYENPNINRFKNANIKDMSALESLHKMTAKYAELGKTLYLKNLNPDSEKLVKNAKKMIRVNY